MKPAPQRAAVLADLVQRLDHERILPDALGDGRQLAGLDQRGELRRFLEGLGELRGVGDDLRAFELPDERALAGALRERAGGDDAAEGRRDESDRDTGSERARLQPKWPHDASPFSRVLGRPARAPSRGADYGDISGPSLDV